MREFACTLKPNGFCPHGQLPIPPIAQIGAPLREHPLGQLRWQARRLASSTWLVTYQAIAQGLRIGLDTFWEPQMKIKPWLIKGRVSHLEGIHHFWRDCWWPNFEADVWWILSPSWFPQRLSCRSLTCVQEVRTLNLTGGSWMTDLCFHQTCKGIGWKYGTSKALYKDHCLGRFFVQHWRGRCQDVPVGLTDSLASMGPNRRAPKTTIGHLLGGSINWFH